MISLYIFFKILCVSGLVGTLKMVTGRGLQDGEGIVDILSKMYVFGMMFILILISLDSFAAALSFFVVISLFWIKIGKSMQLLTLREDVINTPDWVFYDTIIDRICGNPKDYQGLKKKTLIYNIGYTLTALPGFVLLGLITHSFSCLFGFMLACAWPLIVRELEYANDKWKQWATAEEIIGSYLCFCLLFSWFLTFII